jgi:hypothetical protein
VDFRTVCLAGAGVFVLVLAGHVRLMPQHIPGRVRTRGQGGVRVLLRNRRFLALCCAYGTYLLACNQLYLALPDEVQRARLRPDRPHRRRSHRLPARPGSPGRRSLASPGHGSGAGGGVGAAPPEPNPGYGHGTLTIRRAIIVGFLGRLVLPADEQGHDLTPELDCFRRP